MVEPTDGTVNLSAKQFKDTISVSVEDLTETERAYQNWKGFHDYFQHKYRTECGLENTM